MTKGLIALTLTIALFSMTATAADTEFLIASWENTMNHFGEGGDFDSMAFTTYEGVTNGTTALELDIKPGWSQGLRTAYVGGLSPDWDPFFPQLEGATGLRIDVTTCNGLASVPMTSGIQLGLMIRGQSGDGMPMFQTAYGYKTIQAVYSTSMVTETIEWDLTKDEFGDQVDPLPAFSTMTGGWFDLRIHTQTPAGATSPGIIIIDNLRAFRSPCSFGPGDFSGDGRVDQADYTTWADNFGGPVTAFASGSYDVTGGTLINQSHYTTWADNFGATTMPEPATLAMLAVGATAILRRRR